MAHRIIVSTVAVLMFTAANTCPATTFTAEQLALPGKKGVCFTLRDPEKSSKGTWEVNIKKVAALNAYWNYSWGSQLVPVQPKDMEFVPMVWGGKDAANVQQRLAADVVPMVAKGRVKRLLGFNEPDKKDQSNMPVERALAIWPTLEKLGIPLASPAPANPEGIDDPSAQGVPGTWLRDFMKEVDRRGYRVDYIAVHWYGGTNAKAFKEKLKRIYDKYGKRPLLITEFAPADWKTGGDIDKHRHSPARVLAFMKDVLPWLEEQEWVVGYSWFSFRADAPQGTSSALFLNDGSLTAAGRYYRSITADNPKGDPTITPDPPHQTRKKGAQDPEGDDDEKGGKDESAE